jgi:hypothetical protein
MERLDEKAFLIKLDANTFVKLIDGNTITTSTVPSACPALAYDEADAIARLLRRRRFGAAYVSDLLGQPITAAMLREAQDQMLVQEKYLPATHKELDAGQRAGAEIPRRTCLQTEVRRIGINSA